MWIIILLVILALIVPLTYYVEHWEDYTLKPYNYIFSGKDPLYFYRYDRYRRPYRDGFQFYQSYPIPHMTSYP